MSETPALIAAAQTATAPLDLAAAAAEAGLGHLAVDTLAEQTALLWLTMVTVRAGLGLPTDPLRARGWLKFGRPLTEDEKVEAGDIAIAEIAKQEVVGIVTDVSRMSVDLHIEPDITVKVGKRSITSVRRPVVVES